MLTDAQMKKFGATAIEDKKIARKKTTEDRRQTIIENIDRWISYRRGEIEWKGKRRLSDVVDGKKRVRIWYSNRKLKIQDNKEVAALTNISDEHEVSFLEEVRRSVNAGAFDEQIRKIWKKTARITSGSTAMARGAKAKKAAAKK
tara:strand:- start:2038 stop:2472 length:435 start_codon:yes stop_codon:yes gene_type:complete